MDSFTEKWAQALIKHALDIPAAFRDVYPYDGQTPNGKVKSAKRMIAIFNEHWGNKPGLWARVAALQKPIDEQLAMTGADIVKQWEVIANTDRRGMVDVVACVCRMCEGAGAFDDGSVCHICDGTGYSGNVVKLAPTAGYTPEQALCFEGAEQTKHGVKLLLTSRETARQNLARFHGLFNAELHAARNNVLAPPPPLPDDPNEAARIYTEWVKQ